jgi:hypothetical protein
MAGLAASRSLVSLGGDRGPASSSARDAGGPEPRARRSAGSGGGAGACRAQVERTGRPPVRSEVRRRHRAVAEQRSAPLPGPRPARAVPALHRDRT